MKIKIYKLIYIIVIFFIVKTQIFCEELIVEEGVTRKPKVIETSIISTQQSDAKIKLIQTSITEIKGKMEELGQTVNEIKTEIRSLQEKTSEIDNSIQKELKDYTEQMRIIDANYSQQSKKVAALEGDFKEMKDILKLRVDKMQSWDDILDVLKKEISNNEIEIARLKKEINELKRQYGYSDNIFNSIALWPYTGITALIVSIIAFVVVLVKQ
jgi:chromosome segregation ATPase